VFEKALILGLYSVTPVHAGSGAELSVIDLPIQRERHTQFPVIWGQSLKGVLRREYANFERKVIKKKLKNETSEEEKNELKRALNDQPKTTVIFGPDTNNASDHAGAISVGDAKILLFPVRSLKGVFAYVTCPLVLERFVEDVEFMSKINETNEKSKNKDIKIVRKFIEGLIDNSEEENGSREKQTLSETNAVVFGNDLVVKKDGKNYVVLEDLLLEVNNNDKNALVNLLKKILPENVKDKLDKKLVIVSDDVFTALVTTTTEIVARVKIDANTGTVQRGALWYEEYLPSDTLLYSLITIGKPRIWGKNDEERSRNEDAIMKAFGCSSLDDCVEKIAKELEYVDSHLQIGGNETVGKGFVNAKIWGGKDECSAESGTKKV